MMNKTIVIVGGGFAGLATAYQLVRQVRSPLSLFLFDAAHRSGHGIAYSTNCPLHVLNVTAGKMGFFAEAPEHFYDWLIASKEWRQLAAAFEKMGVTKETYMPRMVYGAYLKSMCAEMEREAKQKGILVEWVVEDVIDMDKKGARYELFTSASRPYLADSVVLALSSPWTQPIPHVSSPFYLPTPWPVMTNMQAADKVIGALDSASTIGLIGSGLTMLDMLGTLYHCGFAGKVSVISRGNRLPQPHGASKDFKFSSDEAAAFPMTALQLFKTVRSHCRQEEWRSVIDALRPITDALWHRMAQKEKRLFLRHLLPLWNSHRHRAPLEALGLVSLFELRYQLEWLKAAVVSVEEASDQKVKTVLRDQRTGEESTRDFNLVINCSGPSYRIDAHTSLLIQHLLQKGLIGSDSLGLGITKKADGLFAVGSLLFGPNFETTAVPEIREQCQRLVAHILSVSSL